VRKLGQEQRVRQIRIGIGLGFFVVDRIRRLGVIGIRSRSERGNVEQVHHPLVGLFRGEMQRWSQGSAGRPRRLAGRKAGREHR